MYSTPEFVTSTCTFGSLDVASSTCIGGSPSSVRVPPVFDLFCLGSTLTFAKGSVTVLRGSLFGGCVVVVPTVVGGAVVDELDVDEDEVVDAALTVNVPVW